MTRITNKKALNARGGSGRTAGGKSSVASSTHLRRLVTEIDDILRSAVDAQAHGDTSQFAGLERRSRSAARSAQRLSTSNDVDAALREQLRHHSNQLQELSYTLASAPRDASARTSQEHAFAPTLSTPHARSPFQLGSLSPHASPAQVPVMTAGALLDQVAFDPSELPLPEAAAPMTVQKTQPQLVPAELAAVRERRRFMAPLLTSSVTPIGSRNEVLLDSRAVTKKISNIVRDDQARAFKVSLVFSPDLADDLMVGSSLGSGHDASRRPGLLLRADGTRQEVTVDEFHIAAHARTRPDNPDARAGALWAASTSALMGNRQIYAVAQFDDKISVISAAVSEQNVDAMMEIVSPGQRTAFARLALFDLVQHYRLIHSHGRIHGDGSLENTLLGLGAPQVLAHGLGRAPALGINGVTTQPVSVAFPSPEIIGQGTIDGLYAGMGTAHDVWTLGISAMRLLASDGLNTHVLRDPQKLLAVRSVLFPNAHLNDSTMLTPKQLMKIDHVDSGIASAVARMMLRDSSVAHLVMWNMLDPNPSTRITLEALSEIANHLQQPFASERERIYGQLQRSSMRAYHALKKLHLTADMLDEYVRAAK